MRKKNMTLTIAIMAATLAVASLGALSLGSEAILKANTQTPSITLESGTNQLFGSGQGHTDPGTSSIFTGYGNPIGVSYSSFSDTIASSSWHTIASGGYFENTDQLLGLYSFTFSLDNPEAGSSVKIEWSRTSGSYASSDSETFSISDSASYTCSFDGRNPSYFRFSNAGSASITIKAATILYSCSSSDEPTMTEADYAALSAPYKDGKLTNGTLYVKRVITAGQYIYTEENTYEYDGTKVRKKDSTYHQYESGSSEKFDYVNVYDGTYRYTLQSDGTYNRESDTTGNKNDFEYYFAAGIDFDINVISLFEKNGDTYSNNATYYWGSSTGCTLDKRGDSTEETAIGKATLTVDENGALISSSYENEEYASTDYPSGRTTVLTVQVSNIGTTTVTIPEWVAPGKTQWEAAIDGLSKMNVGSINRQVSIYDVDSDSNNALLSTSLEVNGGVALASSTNYEGTVTSSETYYRTTSDGTYEQYSSFDADPSWTSATGIPSLNAMLTSDNLIGDAPILTIDNLSYDGYYFSLSGETPISFDESAYTLSSGTGNYVKDIHFAFDDDGRFLTINIDVYPSTHTGSVAPDSEMSTSYPYYSVYYSFTYESTLDGDYFPQTTRDASEEWTAAKGEIDSIRNGVGGFLASSSEYSYPTGSVGESRYLTYVDTETTYDFNGDFARASSTSTDKVNNTTSTSDTYYKRVGTSYYSYGSSSSWTSSTYFPDAGGLLLGSVASLLTASYDSTAFTYYCDGSYSYFEYILPEGYATNYAYDIDENGNIVSGNVYALTRFDITLSYGKLESIYFEMKGIEGENTKEYGVNCYFFSTTSALSEADSPFSEFSA